MTTKEIRVSKRYVERRLPNAHVKDKVQHAVRRTVYASQ